MYICRGIDHPSPRHEDVDVLERKWFIVYEYMRPHGEQQTPGTPISNWGYRESALALSVELLSYIRFYLGQMLISQLSFLSTWPAAFSNWLMSSNNQESSKITRKQSYSLMLLTAFLWITQDWPHPYLYTRHSNVPLWTASSNIF